MQDNMKDSLKSVERQPLVPGSCFLNCVLFEVECSADVVIDVVHALASIDLLALKGSCQMSCVNLFIKCIIK